MSSEEGESQADRSRRLCALMTELMRERLQDREGGGVRITAKDFDGSVVVVGECDQSPYRFISIAWGAVEGLAESERSGKPLRNHLGWVNVTSDSAPWVLAALLRVFPELKIEGFA